MGCVLMRHGGKHDWYRNPGQGSPNLCLVIVKSRSNWPGESSGCSAIATMRTPLERVLDLDSRSFIAPRREVRAFFIPHFPAARGRWAAPCGTAGRCARIPARRRRGGPGRARAPRRGGAGGTAPRSRHRRGRPSSRVRGGRAGTLGAVSVGPSGRDGHAHHAGLGRGCRVGRPGRDPDADGPPRPEELGVERVLGRGGAPARAGPGASSRAGRPARPPARRRSRGVRSGSVREDLDVDRVDPAQGVARRRPGRRTGRPARAIASGRTRRRRG